MTYAEVAARLEALPEKSKGFPIWIAIDGRKSTKRLTSLLFGCELPVMVEGWLKNYQALKPADQQKAVLLDNRRTGAELEVYDVLPAEKRHVTFKARHKSD